MTKNPLNFQAILDWCEQYRPDLRPVVIAEKNNDAFILLMTVGFESGRHFQKNNPKFPLDVSDLYLPENTPNTVVPTRKVLVWQAINTPDLPTGKYIVAHRGHAEIDTYLSPKGEWAEGAKLGWQKGDPAARFNATHCALLPDCP